MSHLKLFNRCTMHDISVALTVTVPAQGAAQVALKARTENYPIADVGVQRDGRSTQRSGIVVLAELSFGHIFVKSNSIKACNSLNDAARRVHCSGTK